ncbi:MAG: GNAT family N-acetyltransferase [Planctomycetaceae bacterium]
MMTAAPLNPASPINLQVHVRHVIRRDMPDILRIESACFENPWSDFDFKRVLSCMAIGIVAEVNGRVAGFAIYYLEVDRVDLANLAVDPAFARRGVGKAMVEFVKGRVRMYSRKRIIVHPAENNLDGHVFFRAMGFRCVRIMPRYYKEHGLDGYRFVWRNA